MDRLDSYLKSENTDKCYLDGRYFNLVFADYPGLLHNPMKVTIKNHKDQKKIYVIMVETNLNTSVVGLLRVIIDVDDHKHTNLVLLDYSGHKAYRFEPLGYTGPHFQKVNDLIAEYLDFYLGMDLDLINIPLSEYDDVLDVKNPKCAQSGFCNAYVIMYAYAYLRQKAFDPKNILKFARRVEEVYGPLKGPEEIEYGPRGGHHSGYHGGNYRGGYGGNYHGGYRGGYGAGGALLGGLLLGSALGTATSPYPYYGAYPPYTPYAPYGAYSYDYAPYGYL